MTDTAGSREDARVAKTREALRDALLSMLATERFETISAAALARRAGIGYATFFRRYADTRDLLAEVAGKFIDELAREVAPAVMLGEGRLAAARISAFTNERWSLCRALLVGAGDEMRKKLTAQALIAARALDQMPEQGIPRELRLRVSIAACIELLSWWLENREDGAGLEDALARLVFDPLIGAALPQPAPAIPQAI
ncbi:TetR/AcrR family transcriptional regulator [Sphingomonas sp. CCH5-D11]|uniref:TetR/AcrR family transcriptional regulator n=1 Tax=Sphingomonas sp. CCH5-D11 TaxID=1768786 RepID=UPI000836F288|nr:hypothetical protein [Sphingomonas sp. CCH5-D11]